MKKNKGITLIALIITIILLLILVGVSINLAIKGNLFGSAEKAVSATNDKVGKQQSIIDELMDEFDAMEVEICSHIWEDGAILKESTCTADGKKQKICENCKKVIDIETPALGHNFVNRVCTRCGEAEPGCTTHTYGDWVITKSPTCIAEGSRKRSCTVCGVEQVEVIEATGIHNYVNRVCTMCGAKIELVIGANINYHEYISESEGTVSASYTSTKTTRGSTDSSDSNATYSVVNNSGIQWIVLGEENEQIKITTKNIVQPTSGGYTSGKFKYLRLQGQNGYTNCIDELNKISAVYGKGKYADTTKFSTSGGRSFKMEDLGYGSLTRTASYKYARHSNGQIYRYAANAIVDGTSTTGGKTETFNYMALDASNSTEETTSSHTWKSLSTTANSYVKMYQYIYSGNQTLPTTVSKADTYYWIASRYLNFGSVGVSYHVYYVDTSGITLYYELCSSYGNNTNLDLGVRPVVYLKSNIQLSYDETNGYIISE